MDSPSKESIKMLTSQTISNNDNEKHIYNFDNSERPCPMPDVCRPACHPSHRTTTMPEIDDGTPCMCSVPPQHPAKLLDDFVFARRDTEPQNPHPYALTPCEMPLDACYPILSLWFYCLRHCLAETNRITADYVAVTHLPSHLPMPNQHRLASMPLRLNVSCCRCLKMRPDAVRWLVRHSPHDDE
ncbi:hypothetical protein JCM19237_2330 [Photobacterium aphoticum]|uniref:Uncharacterized protein n=1 Tax=Photobacterium aphoticum TaxID=754436 RepID=A0A090QQS2_9GAMM|nr:hypothetical protein JCM19237_2330 [Photobacterium aphoticum]